MVSPAEDPYYRDAIAAERFLLSPDAWTADLSRVGGLLVTSCVDKPPEYLRRGESHMATLIGPGATHGTIGNYQLALSIIRERPISRVTAQEAAMLYEPDILLGAHEDCLFRGKASEIYFNMANTDFLTNCLLLDALKYNELTEIFSIDALEHVAHAVTQNYSSLTGTETLEDEKQYITDSSAENQAVRMLVNTGTPFIYFMSHSRSMTLDRVNIHEVQQLEALAFVDALGLRLQYIKDNPELENDLKNALLFVTAYTSAATAAVVLNTHQMKGEPLKFAHMFDGEQEPDFLYPTYAQTYRDKRHQFPWLLLGTVEDL